MSARMRKQLCHGELGSAELVYRKGSFYLHTELRSTCFFQGAAKTGMLPDELPADIRSQVLSADIVAEPILYLCSDAANGLNNERIVAKDFSQWLANRAARLR